MAGKKSGEDCLLSLNNFGSLLLGAGIILFLVVLAIFVGMIIDSSGNAIDKQAEKWAARHCDDYEVRVKLFEGSERTVVCVKGDHAEEVRLYCLSGYCVPLESVR